MYRAFGKRAFDLVTASLLLLASSPFLLIAAILVRVKLGSPVLFRQVRAGYHDRHFTAYKFRTMTEGRDAGGQLLPDHKRLTPFGKWLRASSIDELPGLWNVVIGNMSLVGPRPLLTEYVPLYSAEQRRRHDVHPGITGWAQVNGRNSVTWEQRFALDIHYVDHLSLWLDLNILARTVVKVVRRDGIDAGAEVTMTRFEG